MRSSLAMTFDRIWQSPCGHKATRPNLFKK
jgi:hypothetical protein